MWSEKIKWSKGIRSSFKQWSKSSSSPKLEIVEFDRVVNGRDHRIHLLLQKRRVRVKGV